MASISSRTSRSAESFARAAANAVETQIEQLVDALEVQFAVLMKLDPQLGEADLRLVLDRLSSLSAHSPLREFAAGAVAAATPDASAPVKEPRLQIIRGAATEESPLERLPEIETQIMDILEAEPRGMGLGDVHERLLDLGYPLTRGNLSVRLHRMVRAWRVETPARGFYALSPSAREKRDRERQAG